eukprot:556629_1
MAWNRQPQQFQQRNNYRQPQQPQPPHYAAPSQPRPQALKRQASELKSCYPLTKWCACYVHTKSSASGDYASDNLGDVTSKIEQTNIYVPMDLEKTIIKQVQEYIDEEKELKHRLSQQKKEVSNAKDEKINTFMSFTSITDKTRARELLEANDWDLEKAAAQQFSSSPSVAANNNEGPGSYNSNPNGQSAQAQKAIIRMILPDNRQYTYQMDYDDSHFQVLWIMTLLIRPLIMTNFTCKTVMFHDLFL